MNRSEQPARSTGAAIAERAGYSIVDFAREAGVSRGLIFKLWAASDPVAPAKVKIASRTLIVETPRQWLARVAEMQAVDA